MSHDQGEDDDEFEESAEEFCKELHPETWVQGG